MKNEKLKVQKETTIFLSKVVVSFLVGMTGFEPATSASRTRSKA